MTDTSAPAVDASEPPTDISCSPSNTPATSRSRSPSPSRSRSPSPSPSRPQSPASTEKLDRIKFLVDQSKLYTQFLTENLDTTQSDLEIHANLAVKLHKHQQQALNWMLNLYQNGLNGILADEMGLGKTLEMISFLSYLDSQGITGPFLVVAPLSTLGNWCREIENFAPHLEAFKYYGSAPARRKLHRKLATAKLVVTSYEIIMADAKVLGRIKYKYIIVDEGHRIKNVNCKLVKELKKFTSANRMLLTGTPLQNNLTELWALLNFLMPDVFTDIDIFHSWFEQGIEINKETEGSLVASLHSILRPFVLRRLKSEVSLKLPPKREYVINCGLSKQQKDLYQHLLEGDAKEFITDLARGSVPNRAPKRRRLEIESQIKQVEMQLRHKTFNNLVMQLRQVCNSPILIYSPYTSTDTIDEEIESSSGKLVMLWKFMQKLKGHKVILFSQFTGMLDILEDWALFRNISLCRIDGSTSQQDREEMMLNFQNDPDIQLFLLSTRSGGQGINLTAADTVIIFDSDWNPHQDLQAMDRVHRIGQKNPVLVFRFVSGDTIEQTLLQRARAKLEFGDTVIERANLKGVGLTQTEQMEQIHQQFNDYRDKYSTNVTLSDEDFNQMLDRSQAAYDAAAPVDASTATVSIVK